ncbi:hypothetical protein ABS772_23490 [Methylorubrum podarium]|uniref:Uncharacterized protein n=1 Tax=Methylorubrum podarium TaxID=200476 RepID=A0ABV1QTZ2_9HYPH
MTDRMVGVSVRFVPAGVAKGTGDAWLLRGTLTLAPVTGPPAEACGGKKVDISRWPQAIEELIGRFDGSDRPDASALAVMISAVREVAASPDRPTPNRGTWRPVVRAFARKQSAVDNDARSRRDARARQVNELGEMWTRLLAPGGDKDWASLLAALETGTKPGGVSVPKSAAERLARTRVDGTGDKQVPDILPTGRGEMGLLLALERGRSVLERLRDPTDAAADKVVPPFPPDRDGRRGERLRTRAPRAANGALALLPWLDVIEPARVRYAQATATDAGPEPSPAVGGGAVAKLSLEETRKRQRFASARERAAASRRLNQEVESERTRTDAQVDARRDYINAKSSAQVEKGLLGLTRIRVACASPAESRDCVAKDRPKEFDGTLQRLRVLHAAATRVDELDPQHQISPHERSRRLEGVEAARARYFALQSQPALARLFNLAVDVVIPLDDGVLKDVEAARVQDEVVGGGRRAEARYLFVTARVGLPCDRLVWTTCKIRLNGNREPTHFWACTREELDARAIGWSQKQVLDRAIATQMDGLLDLGAARTEGGVCNPRFDLQTLDAPRVSEGELQTVTKVHATETKLTPVTTLVSAGLVLVDRWRQSQAVFQAVASSERREQAKKAGPRDEVVDVEDLTVGLKLDLGMDIAGKKGKERAWRSLVDRDIAFAREGKRLFEAEIATLVPNEAERRELFSAVLTLPSRLRTNSAQSGEGKVSESKDTPLPPATAFVEEVVAQWHGLPLGVDLEGGEVPLAETGLLQLSQTYSLPDTPDRPRPPRQRFGWPYRFGVRPQLAGGVALSLKEATALYDDGHLHRFALPKTRDGSTGRRVLRHERIEGPVIATSLSILQRDVRGPQETATELVVRSQASEPQPGASPTYAPLGRLTTHRILVPPPVSLDFADRHDMFEPKPGREPPGGLRAVDYDTRPKGGFPIWSTQETSSGKVYPQWNPGECRTGPDRREVCPYPEPTGDAIFRPIGAGIKPDDRKVAYYPDPAADFMVFRLRRPDGGDLPGKFLVVPIRQKGVAFPEVTPIVIDVVATLTRSEKEPTHERILGLDVGLGTESFVTGFSGLERQPAAVFVDAGETIERKAGSGRVQATRVRVLLEPGESFQLDAWCLPSPDSLVEWFDVVESAALVADAFGRTPATCQNRAKFLGGVADFLGRELDSIENRARRSDWHERDDEVGCGGGQLPLPPRFALECVAGLIRDGMLAGVVPEVAARTTIRCTHAINRPALPPSFEVAGAPQPNLTPRFALQRLDAAERSKTLAENATGEFQLVGSWSTERAVPGSTDVVLGGTIWMDLATTRFLEVRANGPSLVSAAFDDPRRGRSADDRARGIWPNDAERDAPRPIWRRPLSMFGFEVREDGTVELPTEQANLLRLEDFGTVDAAPGLRPVNILARQRERVNSEVDSPDPKLPLPPVERVTRGIAYPDKVPDTKARILTVELVAGSKTAPLIWDATGAALGADQQVVRSETRRVALPSTKAPAKVDPLSLVPAFATESTVITGASTQPTLRLVRTARLRLRARRPWFSSGEGERLGIVLWPPEILDGGIDANTDLAHRGYDVEADEQERMNLRGFSDVDLGPGGAFVSRWGADPIKAGARPRGWLLSPTQFRDVSFGAYGQPRGRADRRSWTPLKEGAERDEVIYVPHVRMPLPVEPAASFQPAAAPPPVNSAASSPPAAAPAADLPSMEVALLAYRPRFDVDAEHWYFDLDIDPLEVPEPFVRLGLVRYQANAPSALRVSEPTVEWAQLLPRREVEVRPNGRRVTVSVKGAGSHLPAPTRGGATTREDASAAAMEHGPFMTIVVYRRSADGIETVARLAAPKVGEGARRDRLPLRTDTSAIPSEPDRQARERAEEAVRPKQDGAGLWWEATFDLDEDPQSPAEQGATYAAVVTEVNLMRPGTYPEEPFDPAKAEDKDRLVPSGPRFAARIAIPRQDAPKLPHTPVVEKPTFLLVHGES